ncbi:basic proline-rich protein-like [Cervus elaphus]|uniref:basic proline-rich protein-like n=1 Tax=Cervus elaphus TaxID=9860 RepID=UPI001CC285B3|nr:basic proline-rich protein-like [Cervus elaphus]
MLVGVSTLAGITAWGASATSRLVGWVFPAGPPRRDLCAPSLPPREPTQDQHPLGVTSGARESQPARDLALNGPAAQRGGWHAGHGEAGVSVATGPTPRGRSPSLVFGCGHRRGRCRPALATTTAHAPTPTPTRPVRPHLLPTTTDSRRTSTSPGASRPPPGAADAAPQEGGGGGWGWEASGGSWWKRREVATAAKRFAPGHGGAGLNRAWAGGAGSRGLCGSAEQAASGPPARPRHRGAHTRPWQGKSSRPPALSVRLPWRAVLLSAASKHCARHRLLAHTPKAARQLPGSLLPALSAPNAPAGRAAELSKRSARCPGPPPDAGPGLAPAHSRRRRRRIPAPTPRQREALRRRRRHQQPTSNPIRASSTQRPGSTGPTAPGRRSRGLAAPRPFAPRRGPRTPPPSPPGGNAGHAASSSQLAKALLHRALGEATSHDDRGTREPAACRRHGALPRRAGREPRSPLRQPLWAGGPQDPAIVGQGRGGGQGGRRSAVATERPATTEGSGWRAAPAGILTTILTRTAATALPPGPSRALGLPAHASPVPSTGPDPTAHQTNRLGHRGGPRPRHGPGPPGALDTPRARRLLPPTRPFRREKGVREGKRGCEDTVGARRPASGEEGRGRPPACLARRTARPATGAGARAASGLSQASGHAPAQARPFLHTRPPPATRNLQSFSAQLSSPGVCGCSCCFSGLPACASRTLAHPPTRKAPPRPTPVGADARGPAPGGEPSSLRGRRDFCLLNGQVALAALLPRPPPAAPPPAGTLSSAPAPPARLRHPATPRRPSPPPALPARGLLRALHASPPCGLGRATPACLPPGTRATHPCCGPANTGLPCTNPSREGRSAGVGAEALRARPAQPQAPSPRPGPRRHRARSRGEGGEAAARAGAKRGLACSLPQPAVPEPGAALPKGPSSPPPPPTLSERSARERRRPERRSQAHNAFGSWGLSAARGGGGGAPGSRAPALASTQHRPSPGSRPPPAMVAERNVGARPRRPRSACPRRRRRLLAPSGDTDSVAAAVVGAEGAGPAEWAGGPPPRGPSESAAPWGPARARTLALRSAARRLLLGWSRQMPTGRAVSSDGRVLASASGAASGGGGHRCMGGSVLPTTPPAPTHGPAAKPLWPQALRAQPPVCPDTSLVVAGFLTRTQPVAHGLRWKAHPTSGSRRPHLFTFPNVCLQAPWLTLATLRESITLPSALLRQ